MNAYSAAMSGRLATLVSSRPNWATRNVPSNTMPTTKNPAQRHGGLRTDARPTIVSPGIPNSAARKIPSPGPGGHHEPRGAGRGPFAGGANRPGSQGNKGAKREPVRGAPNDR